MSAKKHQAEVAEVDEFFREQKSLTEALPVWRDGHVPGKWTAEWPILNVNQVAIERTRLVFSCKKSDIKTLSVSVLYRNARVAGIDLVHAGERKDNPPQARSLGLPPVVLGPHFHLWEDNRGYVLANGLGDVKVRRPTPEKLTTLPQALKALVQRMNFVLTPEQLSFNVPRQGYLALGGDDDL